MRYFNMVPVPNADEMCRKTLGRKYWVVQKKGLIANDNIVLSC